MGSLDDFPVIDFSTFDSSPDGVAKKVASACESWGFLVLTGHKISQNDIDRRFGLSAQFFAIAK